MTPRELIAEAWAIVSREKLIRRWAFASSLLQTLFSLKLLIYQVYFAYTYFFLGEGAGFFDIEIMLFHSIPFGVFLTLAILFILLIVVELLLPHICHGAIVGLAAKSFRGESMKGGLVLGLYNFFPIFGIHEFLVLASTSMAITISSLILRYVSAPLSYWSIGMLLILFCISNVLKFFFSFGIEAIVIEKKGVIEAIGRSFKLIVSHLAHVMFLLLLLFVIAIRIALNVAMVIIIPGLVIGLGSVLTFFLSPLISYSIAGTVGVALIIVASYFFAYIQAFKYTVWTITYLELMKEKDLDVIL